jgi:hypothetical protein
VSLRYLKPVKSDKVGQIHSSELEAPIAQLAEAADLKSVQCRFESDWGHGAIAGQRLFFVASRDAQMLAGTQLVRSRGRVEGGRHGVQVVGV